MQPPEFPDPPFTPLQEGDPLEIGGYRVLARLGAGGMGRVYLAATQSGRRLAIKVVRAEFADDGEFLRRFEREVAAAQRVDSRFTAPVIDAQLGGPQPWMATVHVPGPSLAQAVALHGPMPENAVRTLLIGMAEALQAIHGAQIVHRDLKPSNVLLAEDGPRVIDFGIARATDTTPLTRTGMRIGSPQFMAPEQALGHESGTAVDFFALGSVIFFAATGRTPFGDGPDTAVLFRIAHKEPNLEDCPTSLRGLVERCLDKDPAGRPDARAILSELKSDEDAPAAGWLPDDITRHLPAYTADPPPPVPLAPGGTAPLSPNEAPSPRTGTAVLPPGGLTQPPTAPPGAAALHQLPPPGPWPRVPPRAYPFPPPGRPFPPGPWRLESSGSTAIKVVAGGVAALVAVLLILTIAFRMANARLNTKDKDASTVAPSSDSAGYNAKNSVREGTRLGRYMGINLSKNYMVSFTDDPKHPKQNPQALVPTRPEGADVSYDGYSLAANRLSVLPAGRSGSYVNCRDSTRYANRLTPNSLVQGKLICVTTDSGLVGLIKIKESGNEPDPYIVFDLTVYQGVTPGN